ncbi:MAG TPA: NUMOD4 domain-containing protein, partial [Micromonospora sp.]
MSQSFTAEELAAEEWRPVAGCSDLEVSDLGRVRDSDGHALVRQSDRHGYRTVKVHGRNRLVHHLVLESFVGTRPDGCLTRHFPDPTKSNNRLANISWGTPAQNCDDRGLHGQGAC